MHLRALGRTPCILITLALAACNPGERNTNGNRLSSSSSPYLREHADNPVNWFEWGTEAIEKATREKKPVIISIGYASCHWCHVMEEETFMDTAVARIMNKDFVAIKIDREERPDIDQIYINASQIITGHAGWPLNVFALPDGRPFYAGTYFPKEQWKSLLGQITKAYQNDYDNIQAQADEVAKGVITNDIIVVDDKKVGTLKSSGEIFSIWDQYIDYDLGGIGRAPKFPLPVVWEFLLQENYLARNEKALKAVTTTLDAIANGGIYDQLAGGFARYSTDGEWRVPHFEKMLYDNGQLVSLYSHAYQVTKNDDYARVVNETIGFIKAELTSPGGGFYSSLNADSEGEEGAFYVWTKDEIQKTLGPKSSPIILDFFNLTAEGNWEDGKNVLARNQPENEIAKQFKLTAAELQNQVTEAKSQLLTVRKKRIHPTLDDKILTSWNALMLIGYVDAYWALGKPEYLNAALQNAQFVEKELMGSDGHLFRSFSKGKGSIDAFLDDYTMLASAFIQLYQATFDIKWLQHSRRLCDYVLKHFQDKTTGFFYYTSDLSQKLIARKMETTDQVMPSSNAMMAEVLFKLGNYFSNDSYLNVSRTMVQNLPQESFDSGPFYAKWASLMAVMNNGLYEVAIVGTDASEKCRNLMQNFLPNILLLGGSSENLPLLENKLVTGKTIIYVCRNKVCKLPVEDVSHALKQLN